jgi:hypothetical protein
LPSDPSGVLVYRNRSRRHELQNIEDMMMDICSLLESVIGFGYKPPQGIATLNG